MPMCMACHLTCIHIDAADDQSQGQTGGDANLLTVQAVTDALVAAADTCRNKLGSMNGSTLSSDDLLPLVIATLIKVI